MANPMEKEFRHLDLKVLCESGSICIVGPCDCDVETISGINKVIERLSIQMKNAECGKSYYERALDILKRKRQKMIWKEMYNQSERSKYLHRRVLQR